MTLTTYLFSLPVIVGALYGVYVLITPFADAIASKVNEFTIRVDAKRRQ